ncbi:MAG TPA: sugar ABC transporter permease [Acidothermaceae bacterium]
MAFLILPLIAIFWLSTQSWDGILDTPHYIGLHNFRKLVGDTEFHAAVKNTAIQLAVELAIIIPAGFCFGYFLSLRRRGWGALTTIFFIPILISASARAVIFTGVFTSSGLLNGLLTKLGLISLTQPWLANSHTALYTVVAVDLWAAVGFNAVMTAGRLSGVSTELREAALIDGASQWQTMWRVYWPLVLPFTGVLVILHFLWVLIQSSQNVLLLTQGGPGHSSVTLGYLLYNKAFVTSALGYSQAIGVVLFGVGAIGVAVIFRLTKSRE